MAPRPRVRDAIDRFVARVRHNIDVHLESLASDLAKALDGDGSPGEAQRLVADIARMAARSEPGERRGDGLARIAAAMRLLDEAATLRGILDALARGAGTEAARVAVLLVQGDTLHSFAQAGFSGVRVPIDIAADAFGVLAQVIDRSTRSRLVRAEGAPPAGDSIPASAVPQFMRPAADFSGLLLPIEVAGRVVAIVYAEGPDRQAAAGAGQVWVDHVEVLVRHAAARLENITSRRTVEVLTTSS